MPLPKFGFKELLCVTSYSLVSCCSLVPHGPIQGETVWLALLFLIHLPFRFMSSLTAYGPT
mgnify:CR=1 FL=1